MRILSLWLVLSAANAQLCAPSPANNAVAVSTSASAVCEYYDSFSAALRATVALPQATLELGPGVHQVTDYFYMTTFVVILGNASIIQFYHMIVVAEPAHLIVFNLTWTAGAGGVNRCVWVYGQASFHSVTITQAASNLFVLFAGRLELTDSSLEDISSDFVYAVHWRGELVLTRVVVARFMGRFARIEPYMDRGHISLSLTDIQFISCAGPYWLALFELYDNALNPEYGINSVFTNCTFLLNDRPCVSMIVGYSTVLFMNTTFASNYHWRMASFDLQHSTLAYESCVWDSNRGLIAEIATLNGRLRITDSQIRRQVDRGVIKVQSSSKESCRIEVSNLTLSDTDISSWGVQTGFFTANGCIVVAKQLHFTDFMLDAIGNAGLRAMFDISFGLLSLEDSTVLRSGSSGYFITGINSALSLRNVHLQLLYVGSDIVFACILGSLNFTNVTISASYARSKAYDRTVYAVFLTTWINSDADIDGLTVNNDTAVEDFENREGQLGAVFSTAMSTYRIRNVRVEGVRIDHIATFLNSSGTITDMGVQNCTLRLFTIEMFRGSTLELLRYSVDNITIFKLPQTSIELTAENLLASSRIFYSPNGLISVESNCDLNLSHLSVKRMQMGTLLLVSNGNVSIENFTIAWSDLSMLIESSVQSNISFKGGTFSHLTTGRIFAIGQTVSFIDSTFSDIYVKRQLFHTVSCHIILYSVIFLNIYTTDRLGTITDESVLAITGNRWQSIASEQGEGFVIDGTLHVHDSVFTGFNTSLFQLRNSSVEITHSSIRDGLSPIWSIKSSNAYGAFLGCVDCKRAVIQGVSAFNLSSKLGGAFAFRQKLEVAEVYITESEFVMCSADCGGALYIVETSFTILDSVFFGNQATISGGALDATVSEEVTRAIRNCNFSSNGAVEGGAVKWHKASVQLINVTFAHNNAIYGADLASYPVALSSRLSPSVLVASGYPTELTFEVLDHYGQRVATASKHALRLVANAEVSYLGNSVAFAHGGVVAFPDLTIYAPPASTQTIIGEMNETFESVKRYLKGTALLHFRNCTLGEVYRPNKCEYCNPGNVTYSVDNPHCLICPANAICYGGANMTVLPEYWRSAWNTTRVFECPLPDKCLGGPNSTCAARYTGKLCNECDGDTYRFRVIECEDCPALIWLHLVPIYVLLLLFGWGVLHYGLDEPDEMKLFAIKNIVNHAQLLSSVAHLKVSYPPILKNSLHAVSYLSSLSISDLPITCLGFTQPEFIRATIGSLIFPVAVVGCLPLVLLRKHGTMKAVAVLASSLALCVPAVTVQSVVLMLACTKVEEGNEWLFVDMSEPCWTGMHQRLVTALLIPSVLVNCILPFIIVVVTWRVAPKAYEELFPIWWAGHRLSLWDLFHATAKCFCLWLILNSVPFQKVGQVSYGLASLIVLCVVTVSLCRYIYKARKCFFLVEASVLIVAISLGLGSYYIYHNPDEGASGYFVQAAFLVLNCGYFGVCIWFLRRERSQYVSEEIFASAIKSSVFVLAPPIEVPPNSQDQFSQG